MMSQIKHITFSSEINKRIVELEDTIIPIYSSVWEFNYFDNTPEKKEYYRQDLINSKEAFILEVDGKNIAYVAFDYIETSTYSFFYIREIDVLKDYQGKGYSKLLYNEIFTKYHPDVIYGEAQNPISVKALDNGMNKFGYYTYWAEEPVRTEYPASEKVKEISKTVVEIFDNKNFPSYINGIKEYTIFNDLFNEGYDIVPDLKHIFNKLRIVSQTKYKSAYGVMIGVKKELV